MKSKDYKSMSTEELLQENPNTVAGCYNLRSELVSKINYENGVVVKNKIIELKNNIVEFYTSLRKTTNYTNDKLIIYSIIARVVIVVGALIIVLSNLLWLKT